MTTQLELTTLKRDWIDDNAPAVRQWIALTNGNEFTSDDIRHDLLLQPSQPNWMGCLMAGIEASGLIVGTGWTRSKRPSRNGGTVKVWRKTT